MHYGIGVWRILWKMRKYKYRLGGYSMSGAMFTMVWSWEWAKQTMGIVWKGAQAWYIEIGATWLKQGQDRNGFCFFVPILFSPSSHFRAGVDHEEQTHKIGSLATSPPSCPAKENKFCNPCLATSFPCSHKPLSSILVNCWGIFGLDSSSWGTASLISGNLRNFRNSSELIR